MSRKHILFVQEDRLLADFFREHLESGGFAVEAVRSGDAALRVFAERRPDAMVIDSLTPGREAEEVIRELRAQPATHDIPIVALPTARAPLMRAVQQAGATRVLPRTTNLPADVADALRTALGGDGPIVRPPQAELDESWLRTSLAEAPETLNAMRHSVQAAMRQTGDRQPLRELLQTVHGLTEQMGAFGQKPLFQFTAAVEALAFDLNRFPEQVNPSTLRTVGQAIDFCGTLLQSARRRGIRDTANAQILIVDDEDGARKIMMAAMGLVGLRSVAADAPSSALAALKTQPFDLVFLDVGLPEMTGFELCTKARVLPMHQNTPIVFITGMTTFQNRVQSSLSGGNDFIGKPFNVPELGLKALIWVFKGQQGIA